MESSTGNKLETLVDVNTIDAAELLDHHHKLEERQKAIELAQAQKNGAIVGRTMKVILPLARALAGSVYEEQAIVIDGCQVVSTRQNKFMEPYVSISLFNNPTYSGPKPSKGIWENAIIPNMISRLGAEKTEFRYRASRVEITIPFSEWPSIVTNGDIPAAILGEISKSVIDMCSPSVNIELPETMPKAKALALLSLASQKQTRLRSESAFDTEIY